LKTEKNPLKAACPVETSYGSSECYRGKTNLGQGADEKKLMPTSGEQELAVARQGVFKGFLCGL
jgi:hypothetical protein